MPPPEALLAIAGIVAQGRRAADESLDPGLLLSVASVDDVGVVVGGDVVGAESGPADR